MNDRRSGGKASSLERAMSPSLDSKGEASSLGFAPLLILFLTAVLLSLPLAAAGSTVAVPSDDDNETVRHQNPDEYSEDGDLEELEGWLEGRLTVELRENVAELAAGENVSEEEFDSEYRSLLSQYVEVSSETGDESQAESFEAAGEEQSRFTDATTEYRETRAEYEEAREDGDEERARDLARELEELATEVDETGEELNDTYERLETEGEEEFTDARDAVDEVDTEVQLEQETVRDEEFVETELRLEAEDGDISFLEPLNARGQLLAEDGSSIANEEITLAVGNTTHTVETDSTGAFDLVYRPADVPVSADSLTVEFVPANQSAYLGAEATGDVSIEQTEPTITLLEVPDELAYGEESAVNGTLEVDGVPVDDVPLTVTVDDEPIGTVNATDGIAEGAVEIPRSVPAGDHDLDVTLAFDDRALAETSESERVTVLETPTELEVEATLIDDDVHVSGSLETADGDGLEDESLEVELDGSTVDSVTTGDDGEFNETIAIPDSAGGSTALIVSYDDPETNLAGSEAETTLSLPGGGIDATTLLALAPSWAWLGLGVLVVLVGCGVWFTRRSSRSSGGEAGSLGDRSERERVEAEGSSGRSATRALFSQAGDHLAHGRPDLAAQVGYAAVRRHLGPHIEANGGLTHREFYRQYRTRRGDGTADAGDEDGTVAALEGGESEGTTEGATVGTDDESELLRDVTEGYERAVFGFEELSRSEAAALLERASALCESDHEGTWDREVADDD